MPKVSIITPCYNSETYIGRTIDSVRAQTFSEWEHIVVDDGSTDGSAQAVRHALGREPRLRLVEQGNGGVSRARNQGYAASSPDSEYVLFLDADDCPEPAMLATLTDYLDARPEVGMVYCKPLCIDAEDRLLPEDSFGFAPRRVPHGSGVATLPEAAGETPFAAIFTLCGLLPSLAVMRRSVYAETGGWDEALGHVYEDTDMFLRIALRSEVHFLPSPLLRYRRHPGQSTADGTSRDREATQQAKLYAKWNAVSGLPPDQQATLDKARAFRTGRMVPLSGLHTAREALRHGRWGEALRFGGGAIRRYAASFVGGAG